MHHIAVAAALWKSLSRAFFSIFLALFPLDVLYFVYMLVTALAGTVDGKT